MNARLKFPAVPVMVRLLNCAVPNALVVAVAFVSEPLPLVMAAVTTTPDVLTGLLNASRSWTPGCCAMGTPLLVPGDGDGLKTRAEPEPAVAVAVKPTGLPDRLPADAASA